MESIRAETMAQVEVTAGMIDVNSRMAGDDESTLLGEAVPTATYVVGIGTELGEVTFVCIVTPFAQKLISLPAEKIERAGSPRIEKYPALSILMATSTKT